MIFTFYYIQKCKVKQLKRFSSVLKDLCVLKSFSHYLTIITVFCKTPLTGFSCIVGPILYTFNTVRLVSFTGAFYLSLMTLKIKYTFIGLYNMVVYPPIHCPFNCFLNKVPRNNKQHKSNIPSCQ